MEPEGPPRNIPATIVGWVIVALVVYLFSGWIIGTLFWLARIVLVIALLGGLIWLYFRLRRGSP